MKKDDKKFAKEEIGNLERYEDVTKYGEFVSSYFAWMSLEEQKNRVDKMENMITDLEEIMVLEKVPLRFALNNRQQQLQRPIDRPMMRNSFLKRTLVKKKKFKKEVQRAILIWKLEGYKKRLINKVNKIIGRKRI